MKLVCRYMVIFFNFSLTTNHLYPLQFENCDSNSLHEVDEDDNAKFKLERVMLFLQAYFLYWTSMYQINKIKSHSYLLKY